MKYVFVKIKHDSLGAANGVVLTSECPTIDENVAVAIVPLGQGDDGMAQYRLEDEATGLHYLAERGNAEPDDDLVYQYQVRVRPPR